MMVSDEQWSLPLWTIHDVTSSAIKEDGCTSSTMYYHMADRIFFLRHMSLIHCADSDTFHKRWGNTCVGLTLLTLLRLSIKWIKLTESLDYSVDSYESLLSMFVHPSLQVGDVDR